MANGIYNVDQIEAERGTFFYLQMQELDRAKAELAASIKIQTQMLATVKHFKENNYYLDSSPNMRSLVLNKIHEFSGKIAKIRISVNRARNRFNYLASSPLADQLDHSVLYDTSSLLADTEAQLVIMREQIPALLKRFDGEKEAGELD